MKLHKKAVAILTVMVMAVSATPVGATNKAEEHWANKIVNQYVMANYLVGDQKNIKNINQDITRDEFIDLINHVFGYKVTNEIVKDIPTSRAYMTREEVAIVLTRVLGLEVEKDSSALDVFKDSKDISEWALPYVRTMVGKGYYGGYEDKTLRMTKNITRAETVALVHKIAGEVVNQGSLENKTIQGNLTINNKDVGLRNVKIEGNLILGAGIGEGEVTLEGVSVKGMTLVQGGGEHSVLLKDTTLDSLVVYKLDGKVNIVAKGKTDVGNVQIKSGVILKEEALQGNGFKNINVTKVKPKDTVLLDGKIEKLSIEDGEANVELAKNSIVHEIKVDTKAKNTKIILQEGVKVAKLVAESALQMLGNGEITEALIKAEGVKIDQKPECLKIDEGVSVIIQERKVTTDYEKTPVESTISSASNSKSSHTDASSSQSGHTDTTNTPNTSNKPDTPNKPDMENKEVTIPNPVLKKAVLNVLGKKENDVITKEEMASIKKLGTDDLDFSRELNSRGIDNLEGLEWAYNMEWLDLSENSISDLTPLRTMTKLKWLELDRNSIENLEPLRTLKELEHLNIYNNANITDLEPISGLIQLKWIDMHHCSRSTAPLNVEQLVSLKQLEYLSIETNLIEDVSFVSELPSLKTFSCNNTYVVDLGPVQDLACLAYNQWSAEVFFNMFGQRLKEPVAVKAPSEGLEFRFKSPVINNEKYENKVKEAAAEYGEEVDVPGYTVDKELTYLTVDFDYDTDEIVLTLNPNVETVPREDFVEVFLDYGMYSLKVLFHITQEGIKTEVVPIKEEDKTEVVPTKEEDKTKVVSTKEEDKTEVVPTKEEDKTKVVSTKEEDKTEVVPTKEEDKTKVVLPEI